MRMPGPIGRGQVVHEINPTNSEWDCLLLFDCRQGTPGIVARLQVNPLDKIYLAQVFPRLRVRPNGTLNVSEQALVSERGSGPGAGSSKSFHCVNCLFNTSLIADALTEVPSPVLDVFLRGYFGDCSSQARGS